MSYCSYLCGFFFFNCNKKNYPVFVWYLHNAGWHSVSLRNAGLFLLQLWTICPSTNWKLAHFSGANALPLRPIGVIALLGASWPFRPLSHITVFGHDTGLEGHWQCLLRAQAKEHKSNVRYEILPKHLLESIPLFSKAYSIFCVFKFNIVWLLWIRQKTKQ